MLDDATHPYLVLVKLGSDRQISEAALCVRDALDRISGGKKKPFFTSSDGRSFAFFVVTDFPPAHILATLFGENDVVDTACLRSHEDDVFISRIAPGEWTARGFGNGWAWLQHRQR